MPGDTDTPPRYESSTVFDDGDVLEFNKAREGLESQPLVQAKREALNAYESEIPASREYEPTPVEYTGLLLAHLHKIRQDRMAA